jgi:hypothetical protein
MKPTDVQGPVFAVVVAGGTGSGLFIYSPAVGAGNLIYSVSASNGTDPYGNPYFDVATAYGTTAGSRVTVAVGTAFPSINFFTGSATEALNSSILAAVASPGGAAEQQVLTTFGPENTASADRAGLELLASPNNQPGAATGILFYQDSAGVQHNLIAVGGLGVFRQSIAGMSGGVPLNQMDFFTRTAATTALTALTTSYAIPADDASTPGGTQTTYHLRAGGNGTNANPATNATLSLEMFGTNVYVAGPHAWAGAGDSFDWLVDVDVMISGNSATASFIAFGFYNFTDLSTGAQQQVPIVGGATVNNTAPGTMVLNWQWASVTGSPTIKCPGSIFTRKGV